MRNHQATAEGLKTTGVLREAAAILRTYPDTKRNDPLTLEELREMDGEPVWVVAPDHVFEPCWMLVMLRHDFVMANWQICDFKEYGKTWLAYRHRPEEALADG